jgi:hypothetical protein
MGCSVPFSFGKERSVNSRRVVGLGQSRGPFFEHTWWVIPLKGDQKTKTVFPSGNNKSICWLFYVPFLLGLMIIKSYQVAALRTEFTSFWLLFFFSREEKIQNNRKKEQKKEKVLNYLRPCVRSDDSGCTGRHSFKLNGQFRYYS